MAIISVINGYLDLDVNSAFKIVNILIFINKEGEITNEQST